MSYIKKPITIFLATIIALFFVIALTITPLIIQNRVEAWLIDTFSRDLAGIARNNVLIGEVNVSITGKISITNLVISNINGYSSPYALKIDRITFSISPFHLINSTVSAKDYKIDTITIKDPVFMIETRNNVLNLDAILKPKENISIYRPNQYKYFKVNKLVILDGSIYNYKDDSEVISGTMVLEPFIDSNVNFRTLYFDTLKNLVFVAKRDSKNVTK